MHRIVRGTLLGLLAAAIGCNGSPGSGSADGSGKAGNQSSGVVAISTGGQDEQAWLAFLLNRPVTVWEPPQPLPASVKWLIVRDGDRPPPGFAPAELNARDAHGRTPLHVATFARRRAAVRAAAGPN